MISLAPVCYHRSLSLVKWGDTVSEICSKDLVPLYFFQLRSEWRCLETETLLRDINGASTASTIGTNLHKELIDHTHMLISGNIKQPLLNIKTIAVKIFIEKTRIIYLTTLGKWLKSCCQIKSDNITYFSLNFVTYL